MKSQALSIYNSHLAIILHHFPDAPKYQQHTAAKKAAVREVETQIDNAGFIWGGSDSETGLTARDTYRKHWQSILTELHKL